MMKITMKMKSLKEMRSWMLTMKKNQEIMTRILSTPRINVLMINRIYPNLLQIKNSTTQMWYSHGSQAATSSLRMPSKISRVKTHLNVPKMMTMTSVLYKMKHLKKITSSKVKANFRMKRTMISISFGTVIQGIN